MIYAFVAPKGFGKTAACDLVKKNLGDNTVLQVNFKDALIKEIKEYFPDFLHRVLMEQMALQSMDEVPEYRTIDDLFVHKPPMIRKLMQWWGTDIRRAEDDDYWVREWRKTMYSVGNFHTLTDDVRFENEAWCIKQMGGVLIRLERPDLTPTDTHKSETEQALIATDHTISVLGGELDKLEGELLKIVKQ